ncbi:endogenous retroviral envelope protein HEMO-like [Nycticebus coucang]|uniref:endogenous retroviral envelope protein HEMO-like n=1 Tax=Nycticebus coucang TaxID=9470 RepID=UPI00234D94F5|nr:endogenous retroviral envelope protein HEMO-like [Nycticebus coucang]XP_053450594.1 endogenous retroviral envelope protein HEMO-like [Nycticebus coucang]
MEELVQSSSEDGIVVFSLGSIVQNLKEEKVISLLQPWPRIPQKDHDLGFTFSLNLQSLFLCVCLLRTVSLRLTRTHGHWGCGLAKEEEEAQETPDWEVTTSNLTPSINYAGLFLMCGNQVYKCFPPRWSECCGLGYLTPFVTRFFWVVTTFCLAFGTHEICKICITMNCWEH